MTIFDHDEPGKVPIPSSQLRRVCTINLLLLALCAGCATTSAPESLWGPVITWGQAEQSAGPALSVADSVVTAAWVGADEAGVHHDARALVGNSPTEPVTLNLPPTHPYAGQLYPAHDGKLHLLWLDSNPAGELRLYAALLSPDLKVERGSTLISSRLTLRYTATPLGDGGLLLVWSGGLLAEPALYVQYIDVRGLPRPPVLLVRDADWPTLARSNNGTNHLYWLQATNGSLRYGQIVGESLAQVQRPNTNVVLERGDRLHSLQAALDRSHTYLFWNLTRRDGEAQSWMLAGPIDSGRWGQPQRLGVETGEETLETGFNSGQVLRAQPGTDWLHWVAPMPGQFDLLPLAAGLGDSLTVSYFQAGVIAGLQHIAPVNRLIGPPNLRTDRDRHLYLAWAEPTDVAVADLKLTTTRR